MKVELVIDAKAELGEGPCWDHKKQLLYWLDISGKEVYSYNPNTDINQGIKINQLVGCMVPRQGGGAVLGLEHGLHFLDFETEELQLITDPEMDLPDNRFNDGKCDPMGRLWAGTMRKDGQGNEGSLYCLETDMKVEQKLSNVSISNGISWSIDQSLMYFIDTPTGKVVQYNYNKQNGQIDHPKDVITITDPEHNGMPDGMTIDSEGMLWIAHWGGSGVSRWNPNTGEQLDFISVPALNVTCCTFGGKNLDELYITTARTGTSNEDLKKYPNAGGVFKAKVGVKGIGSFQFGG